MVAQKTHSHRVVQIEKQEAEITIAPALKKGFAQLANADSAMEVRTAENPRELQQSVPTFVPVGHGQGG